ncbi:hypothetical protein ATKI12_3370 [Kitasatospora sp. Ki12]
MPSDQAGRCRSRLGSALPAQLVPRSTPAGPPAEAAPDRSDPTGRHRAYVRAFQYFYGYPAILGAHRFRIRGSFRPTVKPRHPRVDPVGQQASDCQGEQGQ